LFAHDFLPPKEIRSPRLPVEGGVKIRLRGLRGLEHPISIIARFPPSRNKKPPPERRNVSRQGLRYLASGAEARHVKLRFPREKMEGLALTLKIISHFWGVVN